MCNSGHVSFTVQHKQHPIKSSDIFFCSFVDRVLNAYATMINTNYVSFFISSWLNNNNNNTLLHSTEANINPRNKKGLSSWQLKGTIFLKDALSVRPLYRSWSGNNVSGDNEISLPCAFGQPLIPVTI